MDDIQWSQYRDFYKRPATALPNLLRQLHDEDDKTQERALHDIFDRLYHQRQSKKWAAKAVPFLVECLSRKSFVHKAELIAQLLTLAIGPDSDALHRVAQHKIEIRQCASYAAVSKAVPTLIELLEHALQDVRIRAAYALAWFPEAAHQSLLPLRDQLLVADIPKEQANLILSVGLLEFLASQPASSCRFVRELLDADNDLLRYAAAIYLDWHQPDEKTQSLLRELASDETFEAMGVPFCGYEWYQYPQSNLSGLHDPRG